MFDVVEIDEKAEAAIREVRGARTGVWHQVSEHVFLKRDGGGDNILIRSDHPIGEGVFYIPAGQVPSVAAALKKLSDIYIQEEIDRLKESLAKEDDTLKAYQEQPKRIKK